MCKCISPKLQIIDRRCCNGYVGRISGDDTLQLVGYLTATIAMTNNINCQFINKQLRIECISNIQNSCHEII